MSACDTCSIPGYCCRHFRLNGGSFASEVDTIEEAEALIAEQNSMRVDHPIPSMPGAGNVLPFRALYKASTGWIWWCPNLNRETGRCDDYANRPETCRMYDPGIDANCTVHPEFDGG
jgi:Fe-S-cluster containining protein